MFSRTTNAIDLILNGYRIAKVLKIQDDRQFRPKNCSQQQIN